MSPAINLLPPQHGIHFDGPSHRYLVWSPRRNRWMHPSSTSQVLTISGAKGFNPFYWRKSLIEKHGMTPHEAELYMGIHRDGRAEIGTEFHALVQAELLGKPYHPKLSEPLMMLAAWRRLFLPQIEQVLICESPLASLGRFYTGTPDLLAVVNGKLLTCDWKTKASIEKAKPEKSWGLQLAAYNQLIEDNYGLHLDGALNLMVFPDGVEEVFYNRADIEQNRSLFNGALLKHHRVKEEEGCPDHQGAPSHLASFLPPSV